MYQGTKHAAQGLVAPEGRVLYAPIRPEHSGWDYIVMYEYAVFQITTRHTVKWVTKSILVENRRSNCYK